MTHFNQVTRQNFQNFVTVAQRIFSEIVYFLSIQRCYSKVNNVLSPTKDRFRIFRSFTKTEVPPHLELEVRHSLKNLVISTYTLTVYNTFRYNRSMIYTQSIISLGLFLIVLPQSHVLKYNTHYSTRYATSHLLQN